MVQWSWEKYWANEVEGHHRYQDDEFIRNESNECKLHLAGGHTLLDFGCGSGQILLYLSPEYEKVTGVDFSASLLMEAQKKITELGFKNVSLIHADDKSMWNKIDQFYDRIMSNGVIQYLTGNQIDDFINQSSKFLTPNGKIIFFAVIDPHLYDLWKAGFFSKNSAILKVYINLIRIKILDMFKKEPKDLIGYAYGPSIIETIAQKHGFQMEYVKSIYCEYRYHAILYRK